MDDSREGSGAGLAAALVLLLLLGLAGGGFFLLRRTISQTAAARREAEVARAESQRQMAYARAAQRKAEAQAAKAKQVAAKSANSAKVATAIRAVLKTQQNAWNEGDVESFMQHYWKSDKLTFSSGGKVTRSWQKTLENYQQRYPTRDAMGKLGFSNLEITALGPDSAMVLGRWQLTRQKNNLQGNFTLVFRRLDGKWLIVHDHTSKEDLDAKR